jgi:hypothetical protein
MNAICFSFSLLLKLPSLRVSVARYESSREGFLPRNHGRNIITLGAENLTGKRVVLFPIFWIGLSFVVCNVLRQPYKESGHRSV